MKKIIITHGLISGFIIILSIVVGLSLAEGEESMQFLEWLGYLIMILALSMIFIGIKRYRDRELGGVIRFMTALGVGLGISLVAGIIYVVMWEINLSITDYAFINDYTESVIAQKKSDGVSGEALEELIVEMEKTKQQYAKPAFRVMITFLEIFPVGLLISLLSAAILRNSNIMPLKQ